MINIADKVFLKFIKYPLYHQKALLLSTFNTKITSKNSQHTPIHKLKSFFLTKSSISKTGFTYYRHKSDSDLVWLIQLTHIFPNNMHFYLNKY